MRPRPHSRAVLDASTLIAWPSADAVREHVQRLGLRCAPWSAQHPLVHPLLIELWHVRAGELSWNGRSWSQLCAAAVGEPGRSWAERAIARHGDYHELLLCIPDVLMPGSAEPRALVLGMYTDSALARLGDRLFGFQLGKQLVELQQTPFATCRVRDPGADACSLHARFRPVAKWRSMSAAPALQLLRRCSQQLLIGQGRRPVLSLLERGWDAQQLAVHAAEGSLELQPQLSQGLLAGCHRVSGALPDPADAAPDITGLHLRELPVQLHYPRPLAAGEP